MVIKSMVHLMHIIDTTKIIDTIMKSKMVEIIQHADTITMEVQFRPPAMMELR